jgi:hypothetical protein
MVISTLSIQSIIPNFSFCKLPKGQLYCTLPNESKDYLASSGRKRSASWALHAAASCVHLAVSDSWYWFIVREKYCLLAVGWWLMLIWCERKYYWLINGQASWTERDIKWRSACGHWVESASNGSCMRIHPPGLHRRLARFILILGFSLLHVGFWWRGCSFRQLIVPYYTCSDKIHPSIPCSSDWV